MLASKAADADPADGRALVVIDGPRHAGDEEGHQRQDPPSAPLSDQAG